MNLREFLYSNKAPQKYYRHIAFWICTCLPFLVMNVTSLYSKHHTGANIPGFILMQFSKFPGLLVDIIYTYVIAYRIIPSYIKVRNSGRLIMQIVLMTFIAFLCKAYLWFNDGYVFGRDGAIMWLNGWYLLTNFLNDGSIMRCALFLGCRMLKNYHLKSEEKLGIIKENTTAELQLLKAQVHPHFLFNTLNNIYSFALNRSPLAASLVMKLADTLRYMVTDCESPLVPLDKELKMLKDYVGLESVRYGSRLDIDIIENGDPANKFIAPLLLIPLIENSFKHGTSQMLDKPWIKLKIDVSVEELFFTLANSRPSTNVTYDSKKGIGLKNVQKRLQLLYPAQHKFEIRFSDNAYEVFISVPLLQEQQISSSAFAAQYTPVMITAYDKR